MAENLNQKDKDEPSEMQKIASSYRSGWAYAEYAFQYAMAIVICVLIGYWLDNIFNTGHILLITGVLIGSISGFIGLIKSLNVLKVKKDNKNNDPHIK